MITVRFQNPAPTNENMLYITPNITHPKDLQSFTSMKDKDHLNDSARLSLENGFEGSRWNDNMYRLITENIHDVGFRGKFSREEHFLS